MASHSYYASTPFAAQEQDLRLLPPTMTSSKSSYSNSVPSISIQLASPDKSTQYSQMLPYDDFNDLKVAEIEDRHLKLRIRRLRLLSRILAFLISVAVLVPTALTLHKFLSTRNTYRTVRLSSGENISRTPWAQNTRAWPTYMYFGVAVVSVLLNFTTIFSYKFGIEKANVASVVTSTFSWVWVVGNFVVWCVAAGVYRGEKDKNGKSNDLWGWTCSSGARAIQKEFVGEIDFDRYCNVQSVSWYVGIAQACAALLTVGLYVLVFMRRRTKKEVEQRLRTSGYEPSRR